MDTCAVFISDSYLRYCSILFFCAMSPAEKEKYERWLHPFSDFIYIFWNTNAFKVILC